MATTSGDVYAAAATVWAGAATLSGLNGPFRDEAPAGTQMPYVVFKTVASVPRLRSSHSEIWDNQFDFVVYDRTPELCDEWLGKIGDVFDPAELSLASGKGTVLQLRRIGEASMQADKAVHMAAISYRADRAKARIG